MYSSYLGISNFSPVIKKLEALLNPCHVCPWHCGINRFHENSGQCHTGYLPKIASYTLHHGEEPPLSGTRGSGTIFFSGCSLSCCFCQNYPISQYGNGNEVSIETVAHYMLELQEKGAHNINLVTPTHFVPQIVKALSIAKERGLSIPIVYNTGGYDRVEVIRLLDGIVDIYLPDMKYGSDENALHYSGVKGYTSINQQAIREMYRQVGELAYNNKGIAQRGLIIRHLVLPHNLSSTERVLEFIADLSPTISISLMGQYFPAYKAPKILELHRRLTRQEYKWAAKLLDRFGLVNGWVQPSY